MNKRRDSENGKTSKLKDFMGLSECKFCHVNGCTPYTSDDAQVIIICRDDKEGFRLYTVHDGNPVELSGSELHHLAVLVAGDEYDADSTDLDELFFHLEQCGCVDCPYFDACATMDAPCNESDIIIYGNTVSIM